MKTRKVDTVSGDTELRDELVQSLKMLLLYPNEPLTRVNARMAIEKADDSVLRKDVVPGNIVSEIICPSCEATIRFNDDHYQLVVKADIAPAHTSKEGQTLSDLADKWEREFFATGLDFKYRNPVDCAHELRAALAAQKGAQ